MDFEQGFRLSDLGEMLKRRGPIIGITAGAVFLLFVVVAAVLPAEYSASTMLLVEPQTISKRLVEAGLEESNLNDRLHLMTSQILSRGRLSRIIDDLGLYTDESQEMTREEVIDLMRRQIRVEPVFPELTSVARRTREVEINTFRVFFRHESPKTAAAVANRLANDFIEEHIKGRVQVSGDTSEFIETELERLSSRIAAVENRIAAVKAENPGKLPEDLQTNQNLLERAVDNLRMAQRDLAIAESDESFYRQQAAQGGETRLQDDTSPTRRLQLLELQLAEFRSRGYTDKHPDVVAATQNIAALRSQVAGQASAEKEKKGLSLGEQTAVAESQRAALRAASARQEIERLRAQVSEAEARITATPRVAEQLSALEREYQHLFESYQEFSQKRLEANVAADMERRQKGEQVRVLESAFAPPRPSSPNRPLIAGVGLFIGLLAGAGLALLFETNDSSFHGLRQVQAQLRLPVLASVPVILLESDRVARRRRRLVNATAAAALVGTVLAVAVVGHWVVNGAPGPLQGLFGQPPEASAPAVAEGQGRG
jgi:polysaccharide chain length determinant protein (PEP-CTERM system associated)